MKLYPGVENWQSDIASKAQPSDDVKQKELFEELIENHKAFMITDDNMLKIYDEHGQIPLTTRRRCGTTF